MIVALTGTPATGKTSVARELSKVTGWSLISLNDLAVKKDLYKGYDEKRGCKIVDIEAIAEEVMSNALKNTIIESHYSHEIPADLVIVLRTNPKEIRKRAVDKGWDNAKTEENVQAEIMEICKSESIEHGRVTREIDTTGKTPEIVAKSASIVMQEEGLFVSETLKIPENMRGELREPYGKLFKTLDEAKKYIGNGNIISVGDQVGYGLNNEETVPAITIIDGKIQRKPSNVEIPVKGKTLNCGNKIGYITNEMWLSVQKALDSEKPVKVEVNGEEDMAVLAAMISAEDGYSIVYGLFDKGVCVMKSGKETRKLAKSILLKIAKSQ